MRKSLAAALLAALSLAAARASACEIAIHVGVGSNSFLVARTIADGLEKEMPSCPAIAVVPRPGGYGVIAAEYVKNARGPVFLLGQPGPLIIGPVITKRALGPQDFTSIGMIGVTEPLLLAVRSTLPAKNLEEFLAYAKTHATFFGYFNPSQWLMSQLFQLEHGLKDATAVGYRSGADVNNAVGSESGGLDWVFTTSSMEIQPFLDRGVVRILAAVDAHPSAIYAGVPALCTKGEDYCAMTFMGLVAPKSLPPAIAAEASAALERTMRRPEVRAALARLNFVIDFRGANAFAEEMMRENERWTAHIKYLRSLEAKGFKMLDH